VLTIVEAPGFSRLWSDYWTEEAFSEFCAFLALHPEAGDVIPGSGGCRKLRWPRPGTGKRGGVRVIYFNRANAGEIWLLLIYAKNERESIPTHILRAIREELEDG
jgi:hypothetical protein